MTSHAFEVPETIYAFSVPVLPARDVDATLAFFESILGFRRSFAHGSPTQSGGIKRDGAEIHFFRCDDGKVLENSGCRVRVDGIDALYKRCVNRGVVHPQGQLAQKPGGHREFVMLDPDGVTVTFFQPQQP
jgi:catechol 2,3-dioxygenase-like lactoylglutathione lyase family enzyme